MNHSLQPIQENRLLTEQERTVIRWLLEHGEARARVFVPQLSQARVISRCACGCASLDLAIAEQSAPPNDGMEILSDYAWRDASGHLSGAFVFARGGLLAGLDLWSIDGQASAVSLPELSELALMENLRNT